MDKPANPLSLPPRSLEFFAIDADLKGVLAAMAEALLRETDAACVYMADLSENAQCLMCPAGPETLKNDAALALAKRVVHAAPLAGRAFLDLLPLQEQAVLGLRHPFLLPAVAGGQTYGCLLCDFSSPPPPSAQARMEDMADALAVILRNASLFQSDNNEKTALLRILENIDVCIYVNRLTTHELLFINKKMRDEFGLSADYVGRRCWEVFQDGFTGPCPFCPYEHLLAHPDEPYAWEKRNTVTGRYYRNTDSVITWLDGTLVHLQQSVNVSEEKRAHEGLLEAKLQAEQANNAKSDFLSRMSHEIRTPINAIMGLTRIAKSADTLEGVRQNLERIDSASQQLLGIINDILDMSKISANKMALSPERFDLEKMLIDISNTVSVRASEKKQKLHIRMHMDMPRFYNGDALRLSQVITNLLSNAVKFTPDKGKIVVDVNEKSRMGDLSTVEVSVTDSGIGISREGQKLLFTSFQQADGGIARKFGGTGLGLAICKSIVEMMGGQISVKSAEGKGSTFTFTVQMQVLPDDQAAAPTLDKNLDRRKINTLLIDDEPETREYFTRCMRDLNIGVQTAVNGPEGLDMIRKAQQAGNAFSVVFVDWHMPEIDGIDTLRMIKESFKSCIVVLVSVGEMSGIEDEARAAGASRLISKPLFPSMIIDTINELLGITHRIEGTPHSKRHSFSGAHVLLAEDIEINKDILFQDLANTKIQLDWAMTGKQALEMFEAAPDKYDLILMDVHMPEMDGLTATEKIRALKVKSAATIPIIAMTANVFTEDVQKCLDSGMNDHLAKPVDVDKLFDTLTYYLSRYEEAPSPADPPPMAAPPQAPASSGLSMDTSRYINVDEAMNRLKGNRGIYVTLLKSFLKNNYWEQLKAEMDARDGAAAEKTAHTIKGIAGNLSLTELYNASALLNAQLKGGMDGADSFAQLNGIMAMTLKAIEAFLQNT